jgi:hypothetical protein
MPLMHSRDVAGLPPDPLPKPPTDSSPNGFIGFLVRMQ